MCFARLNLFVQSFFLLLSNRTLDVSYSSWMDWFHGGLQLQVEHHLFPYLLISCGSYAVRITIVI
uniref:Fatty acid desaturase domain-containing protein n=1 Tax=Cajanus cajan TaxID=3821 RepID=A0A151R3C5_CAJCA|nr:hypothetical protein KK1_041805 [Cajanus cajan]